MRIIVFSIACFYFFGINTLSAQGNEGVNWMTWEEVEKANQIEKRKILVDLYTDWCGWCKKMDAKTLSQPHIAQYINENYYAIKFNAQHKNDIILNGKTYTYIKNGRNSFNELAVEISKGKLSFPTVVFMDSDFSVIQPIPGFQGQKKFEKLMTYFAGDFHKSTPWREYARSYKSQHLVPANTSGR